MNAYLFNAGILRLQIVAGVRGNRSSMVSGVSSLIILARNPEEGRDVFKTWLCPPEEAGQPATTQIKVIVAVQLVDQRLTEKGFIPLDWSEVVGTAEADVRSCALDDFEQGYWVDINAELPEGASIATLQESLPEDIRSGLNWDEKKQFFFLLSVLSASQPKDSRNSPEGDLTNVAQDSENFDKRPHDYLGNSAETGLDFPELAEKDAAVLIRARNAAVAAWLWRQNEASLNLEGRQIRIDPWCGLIRVEQTYRRKGDAARDTEDFEGALAFYGKAVELNLAYDWAYHSRGCLFYDTHKFADALADFQKVIDLHSDIEIYAQFRIWLIRSRMGEAEAGTGTLQSFLSGKAGLENWPFTICRFLTGQIDESAFLDGAVDADETKQAGQFCQAYFYTASKRFFSGDKNGAADFFQKSIDTGQTQFTEYKSAVAELQYMKSGATDRETATERDCHK